MQQALLRTAHLSDIAPPVDATTDDGCAVGANVVPEVNE